MQEAVVPMCFLRVKPIGVMHMLDQGEQDDKVIDDQITQSISLFSALQIIAVHVDDPEFRQFADISELAPHRLLEIRRREKSCGMCAMGGV